MPSLSAVLATSRGPTSAVSCEKTELSEYAIALFRSIGPSASPSKLFTCQSRPSALIVTCLDEVKMLDGAMPSLRAVASTNGLNDEPGWPSPCVAGVNWQRRALA